MIKTINYQDVIFVLGLLFIFEENNFNTFTPKNIPAAVITIIPLGVIFHSYASIIPKITDVKEKQIDNIIVFLNPYPSSNEETLGIIKRDDTISTPINLMDITIAIVAKVMNKIFNTTVLMPFTNACSSLNTRYTNFL